MESRQTPRQGTGPCQVTSWTGFQKRSLKRGSCLKAAEDATDDRDVKYILKAYSEAESGTRVCSMFPLKTLGPYQSQPYISWRVSGHTSIPPHSQHTPIHSHTLPYLSTQPIFSIFSHTLPQVSYEEWLIYTPTSLRGIKEKYVCFSWNTDNIYSINDYWHTFEKLILKLQYGPGWLKLLLLGVVQHLLGWGLRGFM